MIIVRVEEEKNNFKKLLVFDSYSGKLYVERYPYEYIFSADCSAEVKNVLDKNIIEKQNFRLIYNELVEGAYSAPLKIYLDITDKCNMNCKHCLNQDLHSENEIDFNTIKEIAYECSKLGVFYIKLGGGEPLMHSMIQEIIEEFRRNNIFLSLSTNGYKINNEIVQILKRNQVKVTVSIEGTRQINNEIRGEEHYSIAIDALRLLKENGIKANIRTTLTNKLLDIGTIKKLKKLAIQEDIKIKLAYCKPSGNAITNSLIINEHDVQKYYNIINLLNSNEFKNYFIIENGMTISQDKYYDYLYYNGKGCGAGNRTMYINAQTQISPCVFLGEQFFTSNGYLRGDILRFWKGELDDKIIKLRNMPFPVECNECERNCKGQCIALRFYRNADYLGKNPNCLYKNKGTLHE